MRLTEIASNLLLKQLEGRVPGIESANVQSAIAQLLPTSGGDLDIPKLLALFTEGEGLMSLAESWLGDGANQTLSADNVMAILGTSRVSDFASQLGMDTNTAASGLSEMIPELLDKASSGGALQSDMAGSLVKGLAGKFF